MIRLGTMPNSELINLMGVRLGERQVELGPAEMNTHKHLHGVSGTGKSKVLEALFLGSMADGYPTTFIDPTGASSTYILNYLIERGFFKDPEAFKKLLYIEFRDGDYFFPLNILKIPWASESEIASIVIESFKRVWPELSEGANNFERIMDAGIKVLIPNQLPIIAVEEVLQSKAYRELLLANVADQLVHSYFHNTYDLLLDYHRQQQTNAALNRAYAIASSAVLRNCFGQTDNGLNPRQVIDDGIFVLINLGPLTDEKTRRFLGSFITHAYENAAFSRPSDTGRPHNLILDEFSVFASKSAVSLSNMLDRARQKGLFLTLAHQNWQQADPKMQGALGSCRVRIGFRAEPNDAVIQAKVFGDFDVSQAKGATAQGGPILASPMDQWEQWANTFKNLKDRQALVKLGTHPPVMMRTLTLPTPTTSPAQLDLIRNEYFQRYYTHKDQINLPLGIAETYPAGNPKTPIGRVTKSSSRGVY